MKCRAGQGTDAVTGSYSLHVGLRRQEYRYTLLIFNISCFYTAVKVTPTRHSVALYIHCLSALCSNRQNSVHTQVFSISAVYVHMRKTKNMLWGSRVISFPNPAMLTSFLRIYRKTLQTKLSLKLVSCYRWTDESPEP